MYLTKPLTRQNHNILPMTCNLCEAGELGKAWSAELLNGQKTLVEAAGRFDMSVDQVWDHVMNHCEENDVPSLDVKEKLWKLIRIAEDWLQELIMFEKPNARTVKQVVLLLGEIRKLLTISAEMKGEIRQPERQIVQIDKFVQLSIGSLCPACQAKMLRLLEENKMEALP
jgi:hypothetical protein